MTSLWQFASYLFLTLLYAAISAGEFYSGNHFLGWLNLLVASINAFIVYVTWRYRR